MMGGVIFWLVLTTAGIFFFNYFGPKKTKNNSSRKSRTASRSDTHNKPLQKNIINSPRRPISGIEQRTDAWYDARKKLLTASDFAAAAGVSTWKSRKKLWRQKNQLEEEAVSFAMSWGVENEETALMDYERRFNVHVNSVGLHIDKQIGWLGCSPDGLIGNFGSIEIKCPFNKKAPHHEVPVHYMPQIQGVLHIMEREWCDFFSWTPKRATCFRVYRDDHYWSWLLPKLQEFWEYMESGKEPPRLNRRPEYLNNIRIEKI